MSVFVFVVFVRVLPLIAGFGLQCFWECVCVCVSVCALRAEYVITGCSVVSAFQCRIVLQLPHSHKSK